MADKRLDTYTTVDPSVGDKAFGVDSGGSSRLFNLSALMPPGIILPYAGTSAPTGFLACDGSAVSRTTYAGLFAAIGTTWGVGDGSTTFNLPDLRETVPVGTGTRGSGVTAHDTYDVGQFKDDQFQGHELSIFADLSLLDHRRNIAATSGPLDNVPASDGGVAAEVRAKEFQSDGTNGIPRTGTTTRTKQVGVLYCVKY